jgi:hypothetical protein
MLFRYVAFLKKVTPSNCFEEDLDAPLRRFNVGGYDCPIFDGLFECASSPLGGGRAGPTFVGGFACANCPFPPPPPRWQCHCLHG